MFNKILLAGAAFAALAGASHAASAPVAAPLPIAAFFAQPQFAGAALSPDGANVAVLVRSPEGNIVLAIRPAAGGAARPLAGLRGMDIANVHWVNNRRLVYSALQRERRES